MTGLLEMPDLTLRLQANTTCHFNMCPFFKNCVGTMSNRPFMFVCNIKKLKRDYLRDKVDERKCDCI